MVPLLPFFQWCDGSWLGVTIRNSPVLFPVIEIFHLFALTILLGTTIVLSLRLCGAMFPRQPWPEVVQSLKPWNSWSLAVMLATGMLLFTSEALKCYNNESFRAKMLLLFLAIAFRFTVYRRVLRLEQSIPPPWWAKLAAGTSLFLWFSVGLAGRAIGFLG